MGLRSVAMDDDERRKLVAEARRLGWSIRRCVVCTDQGAFPAFHWEGPGGLDFVAVAWGDEPEVPEQFLEWFLGRGEQEDA